MNQLVPKPASWTAAGTSSAIVIPAAIVGAGARPF
jgi:hypothetical protein